MFKMIHPFSFFVSQKVRFLFCLGGFFFCLNLGFSRGGSKKRILKSLNRISSDLSDKLFILCHMLDIFLNASVGSDWLRQRKEIKIYPWEEAETSKDSDRQINRKGGSG